VKDFSDLLALNAFAGTTTGKEFVTILAALVAPQSRGTVKIASNDASVPPLIDPGWLTDPTDQIIAIEAFKRTREFFSARAMQPILDGQEYVPGPAVNSDKQILDWIKNNLMTGMSLRLSILKVNWILIIFKHLSMACCLYLFNENSSPRRSP
jgi:choline dehydrogenase-like flavoprotein